MFSKAESGPQLKIFIWLLRAVLHKRRGCQFDMYALENRYESVFKWENLIFGWFWLTRPVYWFSKLSSAVWHVKISHIFCEDISVFKIVFDLLVILLFPSQSRPIANSDLLFLTSKFKEIVLSYKIQFISRRPKSYLQKWSEFLLEIHKNA